MRRSSRIRRMVRMLRRRIRKTETAWRKLCRFLCFSAPESRGTRTALACSPLTGGEFSAEPQRRDSPSADGGSVPRPAAGAKRKGNLRFPFLFELLPFPCLLARRRFPICDRSEMGYGRGFFLPYLSQPVRSGRYRSATHVIKSTQAQHDRVAQFVSTLL